MQGTDGNFYGTTVRRRQRLQRWCGTVFKITPTGTLTTLYIFCSLMAAPTARTLMTDGASHRRELLRNNLGWRGQRWRNVFKITRQAIDHAIQLLCSKWLRGRREPLCRAGASHGRELLRNDRVGGATDDGTIFEITPTGTLSTLYSFCAHEMAARTARPPTADVQATDGNFYGTTVLEAGPTTMARFSVCRRATTP